jgi:pimeloyl-ACP methyl ester carboxylesterase
VLVHGLGVTSRYWERLRRELRAPSCAPDLSRGPKRVEELAAELAHALDAHGIERAPFVANSLGCQTATALALREPSRVEWLAFVGPTGDPRARTRLQSLARLVATSVFEPPSLDLVVAYEYLASGPVRTFRQARELVRHPFAERLRELRCPVLVVRGEHDAICPQPWADEVARVSGADGVRVVRGGGHAIHWSHAPFVARLAEEFEERIGERSG